MVDPVALRRESLNRILAVVRGLGVGESLDVTLDRVVRAVVDVLGFQAVVVNVRVPGDELVVKTGVGPPEVLDMVGETMSHATWLQVLSKSDRWGDLRFSRDLEALDLEGPLSYRDPDISHYRTVPDGFGETAWEQSFVLLAPMWAGPDDLLGVLSVDLPVSGRVPDAEQCAMLELFAGQAGAAIAEAARTGSAHDEQLQYRVVFLNSLIATAMLGADSSIVEVNGAFEALVGQPNSDLAGKRIDDVFDARTDGQDRPVRRPDGRARWARVRVQRVEGSSGDRYVCTAEDRTDAHLELVDLRLRAERDDLTGLAVRSVALLDLTERLGRGDAPSTVHAFMYCDLDRFKSVNDAFGHPAGDRVLTQVADLLLECAAEGDRVCRLGGDEFALVVTRESIDAVEALARRCVESVAQHVQSDSAARQHDEGVRLSIGACVFSRRGAIQHSAAEIVAAADAQLYNVKRSGGNGWRAIELD